MAASATTSTALWLALATWVVAAGGQGPPPVSRPDLAALEPAARAQVERRRASLDALVAEGAASPREAARAYGAMGRIYLVHELEGAARDCFEAAARLRPEDHRWPYYLAVLAQRAGRDADARGQLRRVLELVPGDVPALLRLGALELAAGEAESAGRRFAAALRRAPESAAASRGVELAAAVAAGRPPPAAWRPDFPDPLVDGLERFARRLRVDAGIEALQEGDLDAAVVGLLAARRADPDDWRAHYHLGVALYRQGRAEEAIASVRRALELAPDFAEGHFSLASLLAAAGRTAEAHRHFERAYAADPRNSAVQLAWARSLVNEGRDDEAVPVLEALVAREPKDPEALEALAGALAREGRFAAAAERFRRLGELRPADPEPRFSEALAWLLADREAAARRTLDEAVGELPEDVALRHLLARLLATSREAELRDGERALALAERVLAEQPAVDHAETVAMALAETGRFAEAAAWQEQVVERLGGPAAPAAARAVRRLELYRRGEPCRAPWKTP